MSYLLAWLANFSFIGLKAFQQRNVVHDNRAAVFITSNLLAATEVLVVWKIAKSSTAFIDYALLVVTLGTSGGLGCLLAMHLHNRWLKKVKV